MAFKTMAALYVEVEPLRWGKRWASPLKSCLNDWHSWAMPRAGGDVDVGGKEVGGGQIPPALNTTAGAVQQWFGQSGGLNSLWRLGIHWFPFQGDPLTHCTGTPYRWESLKGMWVETTASIWPL